MSLDGMRPRDILMEARSYPEDLVDFERGNYVVKCSTCGQLFQGFKRRVLCKQCLLSGLGAKVQALTHENALLRGVADQPQDLPEPMLYYPMATCDGCEMFPSQDDGTHIAASDYRKAVDFYERKIAALTAEINKRKVGSV